MTRFREVQPFWHNRVMLVVFVVVAAFVVLGVVAGGGRGQSVAGVAVLASMAALLAVRLVTTVDDGGVRVRFPPLKGRYLPFEQIAAFADERYSPMREFGGWGYRIGGRGKRAYNVSGNRGVRVHLVDGKEVVIGSRRSGELADAIRIGVPDV
ncbi:MAG TPA: hypothetical protein VM324_10030 [Egibacteraceae bacterium]|jgi:hypothetical protein|nr:hypothetical protein [Egibacteraceae bacterium]